MYKMMEKRRKNGKETQMPQKHGGWGSFGGK